MTLCFATNNEHKLGEVKAMLDARIDLLSLSDIGHLTDIPEDFQTMEENSMQKALFVKDKYGMDCFADDSGLEVDGLNGAPGVYSKRFAGPHSSSRDNNLKLLREMEGIDDRTARFKAVITLVTDAGSRQFEGVVKGQLIRAPRGKNGFGYDPLFIPDGYDITFAEMGDDEKNRISHRALAVKKLVTHLKSLDA